MPLDPAASDFPGPSQLPRRPELPNPLETVAGDAVETPDDWRDRRAELEALFRHYVYGHDPGQVEIDVATERTEGVLDGRATLLEATIEFVDLPDDAPSITLALFLPIDDTSADGNDAQADADDASADDGVPVVLGLNRAGNYGTVDDQAVTITESARQFGADERGERTAFWCAKRILDRGYGFATVHCDEIDPDRPDAEAGVRSAVPAEDLEGPPGTEWGTIAAWAWGLSRCVDALRDVETVRDDEIAVLGHSRRGKAALWAGATDERIALVVPHQSGTGGCALSRENGQESVARITATFPHWFDDVFHGFAGQSERLPIDQHCLIAMVAPRPLLDTEGARDYWSNPGRALDAMQAAAPVWELLDVEGIVGDGALYEEPITPENVGRLSQYRLETEHTLNSDYWGAILDFADLHLGDSTN